MKLRLLTLLFATASSCCFAWSGHSLSLSFGIFDSLQGKSQTVRELNFDGVRFTAKSRDDIGALLGVSYHFSPKQVGYYKFIPGLMAFYFLPTQVKGEIIQEGIHTLDYRYRSSSVPVYVSMTMPYLFPKCHVELDFDAGIGMNWLQLSDFKEKTISHSLTEDSFKNHNQLRPSATVGVSLKYQQLHIGYRLFYLGEGHLTKKIETLQNNLSSGSIWANALIASIDF